MNKSDDWKELFDRGDHVRLALWAREQGAFSAARSIRVLADDEVRLYGGTREAARLSSRGESKDPEKPTCLVVTPKEDSSEEEFQQLVERARGEHPGVELAGFGGTAESSEFDRVVVIVGRADQNFEEEKEWLAEAQAFQKAKMTLVVVYTPEVRAAALEKAARACAKGPRVESVVALPLGAGDRIPLPGLTTAGNIDMAVVSALRYLLPREVKVRASWAALGWKVAQLALIYGADELAGWTAAETRVYTGRVRAAARVESEEVESGIVEAGCTRIPWDLRYAGVNS